MKTPSKLRWTGPHGASGKCQVDLSRSKHGDWTVKVTFTGCKVQKRKNVWQFINETVVPGFEVEVERGWRVNPKLIVSLSAKAPWSDAEAKRRRKFAKYLNFVTSPKKTVETIPCL